MSPLFPAQVKLISFFFYEIIGLQLCTYNKKKKMLKIFIYLYLGKKTITKFILFSIYIIQIYKKRQLLILLIFDKSVSLPLLIITTSYYAIQAAGAGRRPTRLTSLLSFRRLGMYCIYKIWKSMKTCFRYP